MEAKAQNIGPETVLTSGPKTVYFDGAVDKANVDYTIRHLKPGDTLAINTRGGDMREAHRLAKYIRDNGINTHANSTAQIQSMGVMIYSAGKKRTAGKNAQFFIHMMRNPDGSENFEATKSYFMWMRERGVDLERMQQLPFIENTLVIDPNVARHIGLVTD